jgi:hypothetical protein
MILGQYLPLVMQKSNRKEKDCLVSTSTQAYFYAHNLICHASSSSRIGQFDALTDHFGIVNDSVMLFSGLVWYHVNVKLEVVFVFLPEWMHLHLVWRLISSKNGNQEFTTPNLNNPT